MTVIDTDSECSLCFNSFKPNRSMQDPVFNVGLVCEKCNAQFNDFEIEILTHCFNVVKGLFQCDLNEENTVKDALFDVQKKLILERNPEITLYNIFNRILLRAKDYQLVINFSIKTSEPENQLRCIICNENSSLINVDTVCNKCERTFSNEEINQMKYIFEHYGGFFHQYKTSLNKISQIVKNQIREIERTGNYVELLDMNEISLHFALLHGITPYEFIEILKPILNNLGGC